MTKFCPDCGAPHECRPPAPTTYPPAPTTYPVETWVTCSRCGVTYRLGVYPSHQCAAGSFGP
ncbi:MAG TPA: hypothetical protein VMI11_06320 [Actinomycetes bacterium]|nr:hypothetical protein [Actinomycetes bacterium]